MPKVSVIDEVTKLLFHIRDSNGSHIEHLNPKVSMTDQDGRLYKFENKFIPIINE
ncbi:MAG TPA: hypothetical protein VD815_09130 [Candidatus Saccharimonadales bacterium]|nr:hypothetical protein [Candidatus Saccharimonadales bacterium]